MDVIVQLLLVISVTLGKYSTPYCCRQFDRRVNALSSQYSYKRLSCKCPHSITLYLIYLTREKIIVFFRVELHVGNFQESDSLVAWQPAAETLCTDATNKI